MRAILKKLSNYVPTSMTDLYPLSSKYTYTYSMCIYLRHSQEYSILIQRYLRHMTTKLMRSPCVLGRFRRKVSTS